MYILVKKKSNIHGFGIFTKNFIPKSLKVYTIPLVKIFNAPKKKCAYIGNNRYVFDEKVLNWVNHSCNPSSVLDTNEKEPCLVSLRDIKVGEEVTCDYSITEIGGIKVKCNCRSTNCKISFLRRE